MTSRGAARGAALLAVLALCAAPLAAAPAGAAPLAPDVAPVETGDGIAEVALVVPVTVPLDAPPILDAELLGRYTAEDGMLTERLDAVAGTGATLAIDPRIPASIRLLGSAAPESATDWLARLAALPEESFLLGYADADPAGLAAAGAAELARPLSLQFAVEPDRFAPAPEDGPSPSATPEAGPAGLGDAEDEPASPGDTEPTPPPGGSPPPTDEELLAWPATLEHLAWPAPGSLTGAALDELAEAGVERLLVESTDLADASRPHVRLGPLDAAVASAELGALVARIEHATDPVTALDDRTLLFGELARIADGSTHPVVLTASRLATEEPTRLAGLLDALRADDGIRLVGLSAVFESSPASAQPALDEPGSERRGLLEGLAGAVADEARFAAVADDPEAFRAERRLELLTALASGRIAALGDDAEVLRDALEETEGVVDAVQIVEGGDFLVLSNSTGLPVTVSNALDVPVTVRVSGRPLRPLLRLPGGATEITIEPHSSHTAYLPAEAVTNGQVSVRLSLTSPSGGAIGAERVVRVDLQAQWETIGLVILVGLGVVFGAGIVRNIVRRRARARERDAETGSAETDTRAETEARADAGDA